MISDTTFNMEVFTPQQLDSLRKHKYHAEGVSVLEPVFRIWWKFVTRQLPLWVSPNVLTIGGLLINIILPLWILSYSPQAQQPIPPWLLVLSAFGLFIYQTLDAVDGEQARRTGQQSPLGEFLDHGCDAISASTLTLALCCTLKLGDEPFILFFFFFSSVFAFYIEPWQTYVNGQVKFGRVDVTEAQLLTCLCYIISAVYGVDIWTKTLLFRTNLRLIDICLALFGAITTYQYVRNLKSILGDWNFLQKRTMAGTGVLSPVFPFACLLLTAVMNYSSRSLRESSCLFLLMYGIVIAKLNIKLVILEASDDDSVRDVLTSDEGLDVLQEIGYKGVASRETTKTVHSIVQSVCFKSILEPFMPQLMQLQSGLDSCGVLTSICTYPDLWKPLFIPSINSKMQAEDFLEEINVHYSASQLKKEKEIDIFKFFCDVVQSYDSEGSDLRVPELYRWITGSKSIPPLGLPKKIEIAFVHGCGDLCKCRPTTSTCDLLVKIPVHISSFEDMQDMMFSALRESHGFGKV